MLKIKLKNLFKKIANNIDNYFYNCKKIIKFKKIKIKISTTLGIIRNTEVDLTSIVNIELSFLKILIFNSYKLLQVFFFLYNLLILNSTNTGLYKYYTVCGSKKNRTTNEYNSEIKKINHHLVLWWKKDYKNIKKLGLSGWLNLNVIKIILKIKIVYTKIIEFFFDLSNIVLSWSEGFMCITRNFINSAPQLGISLFSNFTNIFRIGKLITTLIALEVLKYIGKPLRLFIRLILLKLTILWACFILVIGDFKIILVEVFNSLKNIKEILFRFEIWTATYLFIYFSNLNNSELLVNILKNKYINLLILFDIPIELVSSIFIFILFLQYGSLYFGTMVTKRLMFSTYYLSIFSILVIGWILPEYGIIENILYKCGGGILLVMFSFRALREDTKILENLKINPFKVEKNKNMFIVRKHNSIIYRNRDRGHGPFLEFICLFFLHITLNLIYFENIPLTVIELFGYNINILPQSVLIVFTVFILIRQSTYAYFIWFSAFVYIFIWTILLVVLYLPIGFSYGGLLFQNTLTESTAISSFGLLSSAWGLENIMLHTDSGLMSWYFGELFTKRFTNFNWLQNLDILISGITTPGIGDQYIQPFLLTPHDDHNWGITNSIESLYFNNIKMQQNLSETNQADTIRYWPVERNLQIWFGEYLEKDLYYGWSNSVLIDTEAFFDYSPYSITNIFGDSLIKQIFTEVLTIFNGPIELDEDSNLTLFNLGSNYVPGSSTNKIIDSMSENSELYYTKNSNQRAKNNGEMYHEWFPGLFVLDGMLDVKHSIFFLTLLLMTIVPMSALVFWFTVNGKPSINFDETFGELEVTNYNFFFFGNEQVETFTSYFWSPIFNTNFEWPIDEAPIDPISYEPTSHMFGSLVKYINSGQFTVSILDSFFYVPIMKHTEGFTTNEYKDHLMPILFPVAYSGKYGYDEFLNIDGDFSINQILKNYESINENDLDVQTEHVKSTPLQAIGLAYELNLEYSNLFESLVKELDESKSRTKDLIDEYDETMSGSSGAIMYSEENNFDESGIYEDDTVIDDPMTKEFEENTVFESELEGYFKRFNSNTHNQRAFELRFPGAILLDKKKAWDPTIWDSTGINDLFDNSGYDQESLKFVTTQKSLGFKDSYMDWFKQKNKIQQINNNKIENDRTIAYYGFKNSYVKQLIKEKLKKKFREIGEFSRLAKDDTKAVLRSLHSLRNSLFYTFKNYIKTKIPELKLTKAINLERKNFKSLSLNFKNKKNPFYGEITNTVYFLKKQKHIYSNYSGLAVNYKNTNLNKIYKNIGKILINKNKNLSNIIKLKILKQKKIIYNLGSINEKNLNFRIKLNNYNIKILKKIKVQVKNFYLFKTYKLLRNYTGIKELKYKIKKEITLFNNSRYIERFNKIFNKKIEIQIQQKTYYSLLEYFKNINKDYNNSTKSTKLSYINLVNYNMGNQVYLQQIKKILKIRLNALKIIENFIFYIYKNKLIFFFKSISKFNMKYSVSRLGYKNIQILNIVYNLCVINIFLNIKILFDFYFFYNLCIVLFAISGQNKIKHDRILKLLFLNKFKYTVDNSLRVKFLSDYKSSKNWKIKNFNLKNLIHWENLNIKKLKLGLILKKKQIVVINNYFNSILSNWFNLYKFSKNNSIAWHKQNLQNSTKITQLYRNVLLKIFIKKQINNIVNYDITKLNRNTNKWNPKKYKVIDTYKRINVYLNRVELKNKLKTQRYMLKNIVKSADLIYLIPIMLGYTIEKNIYKKKNSKLLNELNINTFNGSNKTKLKVMKQIVEFTNKVILPTLVSKYLNTKLILNLIAFICKLFKIVMKLNDKISRIKLLIVYKNLFKYLTIKTESNITVSAYIDLIFNNMIINKVIIKKLTKNLKNYINNISEKKQNMWINFTKLNYFLSEKLISQLSKKSVSNIKSLETSFRLKLKVLYMIERLSQISLCALVDQKEYFEKLKSLKFELTYCSIEAVKRNILFILKVCKLFGKKPKFSTYILEKKIIKIVKKNKSINRKIKKSKIKIFKNKFIDIKKNIKSLLVYNLYKKIENYNLNNKLSLNYSTNWVNSLYNWVTRVKNYRLRKFGQQGFKRISIFRRHQLNLSHLDKVRDHTKYGVPDWNYSKDTLFGFFRAYSKILLRSMAIRIADSSIFVAESYYKDKIKNKKPIKNLKKIIEDTPFTAEAIGNLKDMYGKYEYKKTKFILLPKRVDKNRKRLRGIYYFFFKDITETIYPYWDFRLHALYLGGDWEDTMRNFQEKRTEYSRKKNEYIYVSGKDCMGWESSKPNNVMRSDIWYLGALSASSRFLSNFGKQIYKKDFGPDEVAVFGHTIKNRELLEPKYWKFGNWFTTKLLTTEEEYRQQIDIHYEVERLDSITRISKFLGSPNITRLWEYWQKKLNKYTYIPVAIIKYYEKLIPQIMSNSIYKSFLPQLKLNKKIGLESFILLLNRVFIPEQQNIWFKAYFGRLKHPIWGEKKPKKLLELNSVENWFGVNSMDLFNSTLVRILKIKIQWDKISGNYWKVKKYNKILKNRYLKIKNYKNSEIGFTSIKNNNMYIKTKILTENNLKLKKELKSKFNKFTRDYSNNFIFPNLIKTRIIKSEIIYNSIVFGRLLTYKIFKLMWKGYFYPNLKLQNIYWSFSIFRRLNKIIEFSENNNNTNYSIDNFNFFNLYKNNLKNKNILKFGYLSWVSKWKFGSKKVLKKFIFEKVESVFFTWKQLIGLSIFSLSDQYNKWTNWILSKMSKVVMNWKFIRHLIRLGFTEYISMLFETKKEPEITFIGKIRRKNQLISSYNYDQTKDFILQSKFQWFISRFIPVIELFCENIYIWIDLILLNWREYKVILGTYRSVLRKLIKLPYINILPIISADIILILNKIQPITYTDCIYFRDYTDFFIKKTLRTFFIYTKINNKKLKKFKLLNNTSKGVGFIKEVSTKKKQIGYSYLRKKLTTQGILKKKKKKDSKILVFEEKINKVTLNNLKFYKLIKKIIKFYVLLYKKLVLKVNKVFTLNIKSIDTLKKKLNSFKIKLVDSNLFYIYNWIKKKNILKKKYFKNIQNYIKDFKQISIEKLNKILFSGTVKILKNTVIDNRKLFKFKKLKINKKNFNLFLDLNTISYQKNINLMPHISYTTLFCSKKLTITAVTSWFLFKNFNYREGLKLKLKKNKIILMLNCFLDDWQNFENLRNIFIKKILKNKITININNIKIINYLINLGYFNKTFIDQIKKLIRISVNKLSSVEDKLFKILPEIRKIIIELNSILIANLIISEDKKNKLFGIYIIFYNILKIVGLNDIMLEMVIKDLDNKKINFKKNINELGYCTHKNIFKLKKMNLYLKLNIFVRTIMLLMLKLLKMLNFMYVIDILNLKKKLIASFVNIDSNSTFNFYFKNTKYNLNFLLKLINSYNNKKIIVFNSIKTKKHIRIKKLVIFFLKNKNIYNLKIKRGDKQKINQKYNMTFIFKKNKIIFLKKNNKFGILLSLKKKKYTNKICGWVFNNEK